MSLAKKFPYKSRGTNNTFSKKICFTPFWVIIDVIFLWPSYEKLSMGGNVVDLIVHILALLFWKVKVLVAQSRLTLRDPMLCRLPGSSVHGILQARILGWVPIPFSRGSSQHRDQTWVSRIAGRFFTIWIHQGSPYSFMSNKIPPFLWSP